MGQFIVQPRGNGEENMIHMTLPVIATHYLDSTNQWETVGMESRNEAINHIRTGQLIPQKHIILCYNDCVDGTNVYCFVLVKVISDS